METDEISMLSDGEDSLDQTLIEFRAGLMRVAGAQLEPDPRRGLVRLHRVSEVCVMSVCRCGVWNAVCFFVTTS